MKREMILNRINLLKERKADNSHIIRKLQRQLRKMKEGR